MNNIEQTLSIIKPDATKRNLTGLINAKFENAGLKIIAQKRLQLTKSMAEKFYEIHKDRPFFNDLVDFMISGAVVVGRHGQGGIDTKCGELQCGHLGLRGWRAVGSGAVVADS